MSTITIIGLGPGDAALLTRAAWDLLQATGVLYLRTAIHPTVAGLPATITLRPFDALYESAEAFGEVYERIAADLVERACAGEEVIYAVPGHPLVAEATSRRLLALARERGVPVRVVPGLSFVEPVCVALELDPLEHGLQLLDALDLVLTDRPPTTDHRPPTADHSTLYRGPSVGAAVDADGSSKDGAWSEIQGIAPYAPALIPFPLTPTRPALICQLYNRRIASHAKLSLMERYPAAHPVTLIQAAGVAGAERVWSLPLHELDHQDSLDHLTCAYVPPLAPLADLRGPEGVAAVVARLLGPRGCPWDREQTHQSLRRELLEETHEVLEALDAGDMSALAEELGDLLLQVLMHSEMARQAGEFDLGTVYEQSATKLIRRHPHIFGDLSVAGSDEVLRNWEAIKQQERAAKGQEPRGPLDGIPAGLPALMAAQEVARKLAKIGFEPADQPDAWREIQEQAAQVRSVIERLGADEAERGRLAEQALGELLLAVTGLARQLHIDAEGALRGATTRLRRRFAAIESRLRAQGRTPVALSADEKTALWRQAHHDDT